MTVTVGVVVSWKIFRRIVNVAVTTVVATAAAAFVFQMHLRFEMRVQCGQLCKLSVAQFTFQWFFAGMGMDMVVEMGRLFEAFVARWTDVLFDAVVIRFDMTTQQRNQLGTETE